MEDKTHEYDNIHNFFLPPAVVCTVSLLTLTKTYFSSVSVLI